MTYDVSVSLTYHHYHTECMCKYYLLKMTRPWIDRWMSFIEPKYPDLEIPRVPIVARVFPALLARWSVSSKSITGDRTAVTVIEPIVVGTLKDYSRGQMEIDKFKVPSVKSETLASG